MNVPFRWRYEPPFPPPPPQGQPWAYISGCSRCFFMRLPLRPLVSSGMSDGKSGSVAPAAEAKEAAPEPAPGACGNYQQKLLNAWATTDTDEVSARDKADGRSRQRFKVVGSFIENPINVAALCRCSEVFLAESLVWAPHSAAGCGPWGGGGGVHQKGRDLGGGPRGG